MPRQNRVAQQERALAARSQQLQALLNLQTQGTLPQAAAAKQEASAARLRRMDLPIGDALLLLTGRLPANEAAAVLEKVRAEDATIDRALTLVWTHRALRGSPTLSASITKIALAAPWQDVETATGRRVYRWSGATPPVTLKLAAAPTPGLVAVAQFDSRDAEQSTFAVIIYGQREERRGE